MSMRWKVQGLPLKDFNHDGGSAGEPFGVVTDKSGGTIILTKQEVFYEGDEALSSHHDHNKQMDRDRG